MKNQESISPIEQTDNFEGKSPMEIIEELTKNIRMPIMEKIANLQDTAGLKPIDDFDDRTEYREYIIRKHS